MSFLRKRVRQNIQKIHSFLLKMKKITKNHKKNQKWYLQNCFSMVNYGKNQNGIVEAIVAKMRFCETLPSFMKNSHLQGCLEE